MSKNFGSGRDRDQGRVYPSGSQKRKAKKAKHEFLEKLPKITGFLRQTTENREEANDGRHGEEELRSENRSKQLENEAGTSITKNLDKPSSVDNLDEKGVESLDNQEENNEHQAEREKDGVGDIDIEISKQLDIASSVRENTMDKDIDSIDMTDKGECENLLNTDIGKWPCILSDTFKDHWLGKGSRECQHYDSDFKNSAVEGKNFTRHCTPSLFKKTHTLSGKSLDLSWLCYSESKGKLYCFTCKLLSNSTSQFTTGFNNWKKAVEKIEEHSHSKMHHDSVTAAIIRGNTSSLVDYQLVQSVEEAKKYWRKVIERTIDVIILLSERGLSLRGQNETLGSKYNGNFLGIIELISKYDPFLATHIEKYAGKGQGSTSYLSHSICDELIGIMAKEILKKISKEVNESRYYSISVDSTPDITHTDQLSVTIRYVLPTGPPVERFLAFIPIYSHTGVSIAETILKFLEETSIEIKLCRGQSYDNASNMSGKYQGVQQIIKEACRFADFCPCFAHSLNLVGACAVEVNNAASNFFSIVQKLYKFFSSSTHLWNKLEDLIKEKSKGHKILVVKRLSDTRWSARYDAIHALYLGYGEYISLLREISEAVETRREVTNEAAGLAEKLGKLETFILLVLWNPILERFQATSTALQKEGLDLNTAYSLLESLKDFVQSKRESYDNIKEEAEKISGTTEYSDFSGRKRKRKRFFDEENEELVEMTPAELFRTESYVPIIDTLISELARRIDAYGNLKRKFSFFQQLGKSEISKLDLVSAARKLKSAYPDDLEEQLENELLHFDAFLKNLRKGGIIKEGRISEEEMLVLIVEKSVVELFTNVAVALKIYLSMFVSNCKGERSFSKLKLILSYLRNTMGQERLSFLAIMSIESELLKSIDFSQVVTAFATKKARRKVF